MSTDKREGVEFCLVEANSGKCLSEKVNAMLSEGWDLHGAMHPVTRRENHKNGKVEFDNGFVQAMTRLEKNVPVKRFNYRKASV